MIYLFGLDDGFARPGGVAIASLDRFLTRDDRVVVLHLGMSSENLDRLGACAPTAGFQHIDCSGRLDPAWVPPGHVTSATYLRFLAADLLPDHDACLYLDGDVIVRHDPSSVFANDLSSVTLGVVQSRVAPVHAAPGGVVHWFEAGTPSTAPYFNAGVLLMNLARWRENGVTQRLTDYLQTYGTEMLHGDQEAMNAVLHDELLLLDRSWNYITHVTESFLQQPEIEVADPHVVHFAGRKKPWSFGPKPIFAEEWYQHLEATPWAGWRPAAPTAPTGAKATLRRAARASVRRLRSALDEPR